MFKVRPKNFKTALGKVIAFLSVFIGFKELKKSFIRKFCVIRKLRYSLAAAS